MLFYDVSHNTDYNTWWWVRIQSPIGDFNLLRYIHRSVILISCLVYQPFYLKWAQVIWKSCSFWVLVWPISVQQRNNGVSSNNSNTMPIMPIMSNRINAIIHSSPQTCVLCGTSRKFANFSLGVTRSVMQVNCKNKMVNGFRHYRALESASSVSFVYRSYHLSMLDPSPSTLTV